MNDLIEGLNEVQAEAVVHNGGTATDTVRCRKRRESRADTASRVHFRTSHPWR